LTISRQLDIRRHINYWKDHFAAPDSAFALIRRLGNGFKAVLIVYLLDVGAWSPSASGLFAFELLALVSVPIFVSVAI